MKKESFDENQYASIGYDDLVTYSVFSLQNKKEEATFENLVVECYHLFPKRFSLVGYPRYPDSALVNKSWLRCRTDKGLIEGNVANGFKLTAAGLAIVEKVSLLLKDKMSKPSLEKKKDEERSRASKFIQHIDASAAFRKYVQNSENPSISEFELRDLLLGTMQTEPELLHENLVKLAEYARIKERDDILSFLGYVETRLKSQFNLESRPLMYEGGMNKRKVRR